MILILISNSFFNDFPQHCVYRGMKIRLEWLTAAGSSERE
jgi:hypothetical protein